MLYLVDSPQWSYVFYLLYFLFDLWSISYSYFFLWFINSAAHTIAMDICSEIEWYKGKSNFLTALHIIFVYLASLLYFIPFYEVHVSVCVSFHDLCQNLNITTPFITMYPNTTALCGCNVDQSFAQYIFILFHNFLPFSCPASMARSHIDYRCWCQQG